jgi:hypothetical protein
MALHCRRVYYPRMELAVDALCTQIQGMRFVNLFITAATCRYESLGKKLTRYHLPT